MKLHNPFTSNVENIQVCASLSVFFITAFCLSWLISKVGLLAALIILVAIISLIFVIAPFYITIKYIFTGKE